ncbi:armadillo-type protein [Kalaharituber pfeilii]|nr:armadillo-type protein [Kalaharituber pfeilii]
MEWQPSEEPLIQLSGYLKDSLNGADPVAQKRATEILKQAETSPDINNYLTYLFVKPESLVGFAAQEWHFIRQAACLLLKNHIKQNFLQIPTSNLEYLKSKILLGLQDPHFQIRGLTGNVITELIRQGGILSWTDLLTRLISIVEGSDPSLGEITPGAQEGAMSALAKVCEDNKKSLDRDYNGQRPLNFLIPKFLQFTSSPLPKIRSYSLGCINIFLPNKTQSVLVHIDTLITVIFSLAEDPSNAVRREVCRAIVHLVDVRPDKLAPHLRGIVDYMIAQQLKVDEADLSLDAAEFWLTAGEHDQLKMGLGPYLDKIIPTLLKSMVYSDEDIARLAGAGDDADIEDKAEDIKPVFAKSKHRLPNGESVEVPESATNGSKTPGEIALDELSDGEIDEFSDDEEGDDDPEDRWNLRKCSAAALDVLAGVYHQPIFDIILPYLKDNIRSEQWHFREAAVLALGAVADGCMDAVAPHLPDLIPYLLTLLNDGEPLVRQITCWTLGRYSRWAAHLPDEFLKQKYYVPMMEGLLTKMLDGNKRVQEAGASAFASLEEQSQQALTPYIEPILKQFVIAMERYKDRNMFILYDCIQTLAEHVGQGLAEQKYVDILMPALIKRWEKVKDNSRELFPLLECLSYVATALGMAFAPFAPPIFFRCVRIIHQNLELYLQAANTDKETGDVTEWPDKDFLVTSLDLLSAVIQALDTQSAELVANARPGFFDLLIVCMGDPNNDVRQSSYALLGDCAIYVFPLLQPYLPQIMGLLIDQLDISDKEPEYDDYGMDAGYSVINNACWSCGEIALKQATGMTPYVERLYTRLLAIVQTPEIPASVTENAAIAIGRLGLGSCDDLAPHLETFARPFLDAIRNVAETDEKDTALRGFAMIVGRNPEAMETCLVPFFKCIAKYREPSPELQNLFQQTLTGYQGFISDFPSFMNQLPPDIRKELTTRYRL